MKKNKPSKHTIVKWLEQHKILNEMSAFYKDKEKYYNDLWEFYRDNHNMYKVKDDKSCSNNQKVKK